MDWNVMAQYLPQYEKAAWLTLRLGVAGIFWAILVGLVCAVLQYEKVPVLRRIVGAYVQGIFSAATSIIFNFANLESRFEYSSIAAVKYFSLILPTEITVIFIFSSV